MKRWLSNLLLIIFALIFLISAGYLIAYYVETFKQQGEFNELAELVENAQTDPVVPTGVVDVTGTEDTVPPETISPYVEVTDPDTGETRSVLREYAELYKMNNHIVGWMRIDGTVVNYPVMQTPDSVDYYLHRNFDKEYSSHGCLYVKEDADVFAPSDNLTIYGHRKNDGTMFAVLGEYRKQEFYEEHPTIVFDTITEHHTYQIISVFRTTASVGEGFEYHLFVDAADEAAFNSYVATCMNLSLIDTGHTAVYGDKLITLSTCEFGQTNGRLVVVAKRID